NISVSIMIIHLHLVIFIPWIEVPKHPISSPNWWHGLLTAIYGGVTEEIMLRLFGMRFGVWLLAWIIIKQKEDIPSSFYYVAIFLVTILFGLGHIPAATQVFGGLSIVIVIRTMRSEEHTSELQSRF